MTKQYLRKIDPLDSLVKYVLDTKPYHTKIIEVLKEYTYEDEVFITIKDQHWFADRLCKISNSTREEWTNEYQSIMPPEPIYQVEDPRTHKLVNFDFKTTKIIDYPDEFKPKWEWDDSDINKEKLPKQTNPRFNENGGAIFNPEKWCEYKGIEIHHPYQKITENHCEIGYSTQPFGSTGRIDILSPNQSKSLIDYPAINPKTNQFCVTMDRNSEFKPGNKILIQCDIEDFSNIDTIKEMDGNKFKVRGDKAHFYLNVKDAHFYADGTNYKKKFIVKKATYDNNKNETTITVFPSISDTDKKNLRYIGIVVTPTLNSGTYTVKSSKFLAGTIDYFPDISNPFTFEHGDDPHTVVEVEEKFKLFPNLKKNQYLVASVEPEMKLTEGALHYSDYLTVINNSSPQSIEQVPNEGYFCAKILSATKNITGSDGHPILGTGKFVVKGLLDTSNIFAGDKITIKNSTRNVGTYTISNLQYDFKKEETAITVNENVRSNYTNNTTLDIIYCSANAEQCEELAEFEIPANVIIIDGDYTSRFIQGKRFEIVDGTLAGEYITHSSRFINGKTNIKTTATLIDKKHGYNIVDVKEHVNNVNRDIDLYTVVVSGDRRDYFKEGSYFNIIDSKGNDGFFQVAPPGPFLSSTTAACANSNSIISDTEIPVFGNLKKISGGSAIPFKKGEILDKFYGYSEYEEWCNYIPYTLVKVKFGETLDILGDSMFFEEDMIVYNLENNDKLGYELFESTIFAKNEPNISMQATKPTKDEIWFDTSKKTPSKDRLKRKIIDEKGIETWKPMHTENTAWWVKTKITDTKITEHQELYFRRFALDTVNSDGSIVARDSGWIMDLPHGPDSPVTPGKNLIQTARGDFQIQTRGSIIAENAGDGVTAHKVYEIKPHHSDKPTKDEFTVGKDIYHTGSKAIPDRRLIQVKVNNIPALWCFDEIKPVRGKPDEFHVKIEIMKPHVRIGDIIDFEIFKRVEKDWQHNAHVFSYDRTPHSFFHEYVKVRKSNIKSSAEEQHGAYVIGGGNYIQKFNEFTEFKIHTPNSILRMERVKTFPIIMTDHIDNEIAIPGNYTWLFKPNHVFVAQLSDLSYTEYDVERSIYNGRYTLIKVKHDNGSPPSSIFDDPIFYKDPIDTLEIDNTLRTIIIKCDWSDAIFEGDKIKITNSGKGNDGIYTINQVAYDFALDRTDIKVIEAIANDEIGGPAQVIMSVEAGEKSRNIIGAVYNPERTDMHDTDCTLIVPNNPVDENIDKIEYTYPGPINYATEYGVHDINIHSLTDHKITVRTGGKKSTKVDIKDPTKSTFKNPIITLVNELKPGSIFRLKFSSGFYGCTDKDESNDGAYVVKKISDAPITSTTLPETTIELESDFAALPPYGKLNIKSIKKKRGIGSEIVFDKDMRQIFDGLAYKRFFIKSIDKPTKALIHDNIAKNYASIIRVDYDSTKHETKVTIRETVKREFTSQEKCEIVDWLFAPGIFCDANTPRKAEVWNKGIIIWEDHSLAKNFAQNERLAKAVITENLGFTWGNEYEDEPEPLLDFNAKINLIDPIRNLIILEEGNSLIQKGQKIKIENTINNNSVFTVEEASIFNNIPYVKIKEVLAYGTINIINIINNNTFEVKSSLRKKLKVGEYCLIDNKEYKVKKITYNKPNSIIEVENNLHKIENKEVWFTEKCGKISNGE